MTRAAAKASFPSVGRSVLSVLFALIAWLCCVQARAQDTPYRLYPAADASALSLSAIVWGVPALFRSHFIAADGCECKASAVNGFDRWAAGRYRPGFSLVGDVAIATTYSLAALLDALDASDTQAPVASFFTDVVVIAEAVLVSGAINQVVKIALPRYRPLLYDRALSDPLQRDPDSYVSFYSSHTSSAFAVGLAFAQTFARRHPDSPYRYLVYGAAIAAGSGIGVTRVVAGKHFPSDVLAGALAGAGIGLLVPWLHRGGQPGGQAQLSVTLAPHGLGLMLVL